MTLASLSIEPVAAQRGPGRMVFVPTAANHLSDRASTVAAVRDQLLGGHGRGAVEEVDPEVEGPDALAELDAADLLVLGGGDPYHLLDVLRRSAADVQIAAAVARGVDLVGVSAGAIVLGPSLDPIERTSPFVRPDGLDCAGLGVVDVVVLPHHDRPGRAARNHEAVDRFQHRLSVVPIRDDELVVVGPRGNWRRRRVRRPHAPPPGGGGSPPAHEAPWRPWS